MSILQGKLFSSVNYFYFLTIATIYISLLQALLIISDFYNKSHFLYCQTIMSNILYSMENVLSSASPYENIAMETSEMGKYFHLTVFGTCRL